MGNEAALIHTQIPGFDRILGGGIPCHHAVMITGKPGSGKTVLASQMAFAMAAAGQTAIVATLTSEPHIKLLNDLRGFAFYDESLINKRLYLMSAYPSAKKGPKDLRSELLGLVRDRGARLLFIDGLRAVRDLWRDEALVREFLYELGVGLTAVGCLAVYTSEYSKERILDLPEATSVDGIVAMSVLSRGAQRRRRVEVVKLRGRDHLRGDHSLHIDERGISMSPRLESAAARPELPALPHARAEFGLPELDALLHGGLPVGSCTLIAGSTGIGKTLLSLHFAAAGARKGERTMFVAFDEHASPLVDRARGVGLDVKAELDSGMLTMRHILPIELDADQWVERLLGDLRANGTQRLVIDGLGELMRGIVDDDSRKQDFIVALIDALRALKVTAVFTRELTTIAGPELELGDTPTSIVAENLILLRHLELRGRLHRVLSVIKMRSSAHDWHIREYVVESTGLKVLGAIAGAEGLLLGSARASAASRSPGESSEP